LQLSRPLRIGFAPPAVSLSLQLSRPLRIGFAPPAVSISHQCPRPLRIGFAPPAVSISHQCPRLLKISCIALTRLMIYFFCVGLLPQAVVFRVGLSPLTLILPSPRLPFFFGRHGFRIESLRLNWQHCSGRHASNVGAGGGGAGGGGGASGASPRILPMACCSMTFTSPTEMAS
jgi:hypothetical protein